MLPHPQRVQHENKNSLLDNHNANIPPNSGYIQIQSLFFSLFFFNLIVFLNMGSVYMVQDSKHCVYKKVFIVRVSA